MDSLPSLGNLRPLPRRCHPEVRAFCGPKDLCNLPPVASVLRFAQDDSAKGIAASSCNVTQLTQSKNLYQAPANGRNHGLPLYSPSGAPGNGMPTNGFSGFSPPVACEAISSAIFWP